MRAELRSASWTWLLSTRCPIRLLKVAGLKDRTSVIHCQKIRPKARSVTNNVLATSDKVVKHVTNLLQEVAWISFTTDGWNNPTKSRSLLNFTVHFIRAAVRRKVTLSAWVRCCWNKSTMKMILLRKFGKPFPLHWKWGTSEKIHVGVRENFFKTWKCNETRRRHWYRLHVHTLRVTLQLVLHDRLVTSLEVVSKKSARLSSTSSRLAVTSWNTAERWKSFQHTRYCRTLRRDGVVPVLWWSTWSNGAELTVSRAKSGNWMEKLLKFWNHSTLQRLRFVLVSLEFLLRVQEPVTSNGSASASALSADGVESKQRTARRPMPKRISGLRMTTICKYPSIGNFRQSKSNLCRAAVEQQLTGYNSWTTGDWLPQGIISRMTIEWYTRASAL